jgi:hypothetical protein
MHPEQLVRGASSRSDESFQLLSGKNHCNIFRVSLRPEIDYENVIEQRADEFAEFFVGGGIKVIVTVFLTIEREDKRVRATLVVFLGAVVEAVLVRNDRFDLVLQVAKSVFDLLDIRFAGAFFEFEGNDMAQFALFGSVGGHG